jgi:hypothetical protein
MSPEQISLVGTLFALVERVSGWPLGTIMFIVIIGPWIMAMILSYWQSRRFEAVVRMYENNVTLVKHYEQLSADNREVIIMNTQAMTKLVASINTNQFCPMVRLEKKAEGIQR